MSIPWNKIDRERIERVARIYSNNHDAGRALGIRPSSFARLCRRWHIEQPAERKRREHEALAAERRAS